MEMMSWFGDNFALLLFAVFAVLLFKLAESYSLFGKSFLNLCGGSGKREKFRDCDSKNKRVNEIRDIYGLTKNGFLPEFCLRKLPEYYSEWEDIVHRLPELNRASKLKDEVLKMRLLDCDHLENEAMHRRAYIILGMMVHSFVNGDKVPWDELNDADDIESDGKETVENDVKVTNCAGIEGDTSHGGNGDVECDISKTGKTHGNRRRNSVDEGSEIGDKMAVDSYECNTIPCIPYQLAMPWYQVCHKLDLPFILTASLDLWNWKLKDEDKPHELSNLTSLLTMTGTKTEAYFHMVPCAMQSVAAAVLPNIFLLYDDIAADASRHAASQTSTENSDLVASVLALLNDLTNVFKEFKKIGTKIKQLVDVETFYDIYRPFLGGFWPDGVMLELTHRKPNFENEIAVVLPVQSHDATPKDVQITEMSACSSVIKSRPGIGRIIVNPKGPSAGQSTMIILFDLILGIMHKGSGKEFQTEMTNYMPLRHRIMAHDLKDLIERFGTLRDFVLKSKNSRQFADLVSAYNDCIESVADFRSLHLGIAVKYLVRAKKGTGSSSFRDMLNEMKASTTKLKIE